MLQCRISNICTVSAADWEAEAEKETEGSVPACYSTDCSKTKYLTHVYDNGEVGEIKWKEDREEEENPTCSKSDVEAVASAWFAPREVCHNSSGNDCEESIDEELDPPFMLPVIYEVRTLANTPHCFQLRRDGDSEISEASELAENSFDGPVELLCEFVPESNSASSVLIDYNQCRSNFKSTNDKVKTDHNEESLKGPVAIGYDDNENHKEESIKGPVTIVYDDSEEIDIEWHINGKPISKDLLKFMPGEEYPIIDDQIITEDDLFAKCEALRLNIEELEKEMQNVIEPALNNLVAEMDEFVERGQRHALYSPDLFWIDDEEDSRSF